MLLFAAVFLLFAHASSLINLDLVYAGLAVLYAICVLCANNATLDAIEVHPQTIRPCSFVHLATDIRFVDVGLMSFGLSRAAVATLHKFDRRASPAMLLA